MQELLLEIRIVFLSPRPGRVKEIINLDFKCGANIKLREDLLDNTECRRTSRHIMSNMRKG